MLCKSIAININRREADICILLYIRNFLRILKAKTNTKVSIEKLLILNLLINLIIIN